MRKYIIIETQQAQSPEAQLTVSKPFDTFAEALQELQRRFDALSAEHQLSFAQSVVAREI